MVLHIYLSPRFHATPPGFGIQRKNQLRTNSAINLTPRYPKTIARDKTRRIRETRLTPKNEINFKGHHHPRDNPEHINVRAPPPLTVARTIGASLTSLPDRPVGEAPTGSKER